MPGMTSGGASGVVLQGYGGIQPSLKLVDSYPMYTTGRYPVTGYQGENDMSKPIVDPQSGYQATGFTEGYKQPGIDWGDGIKAHNSCINRDPALLRLPRTQRFLVAQQDGEYQVHLLQQRRLHQ